MVVPHAGTWIEISANKSVSSGLGVVPHAGTWIEIIVEGTGNRFDESFPTRERGLKLLL